MDRQHTISKIASVSGIGLHSGEQATLTIHPARAGEGIRFKRADVSDADNLIAASALNVSTTQLGTNLTNAAGISVATVEHFLAACVGMGLDNAIAELDGPELPILDGSSAPFCALIDEAGLAPQDSPRRRLKILKTVEVVDGPKSVRLSPGEGFFARVAIDFPSKVIGRQEVTFELRPGAFSDEIGYARTFGFAHQVDAMRAAGLARGGSMENAIVVDGDTVLNPDGLQVPDEFVRHKLLDVIGDLSLAGGPIEGVYLGEQPGHAMNNRLLRAVFADPEAFEWLDDVAA